MIDDVLAMLPAWASRVITSAAIVVVAYLVGHLAKRLIGRKLAAWASRTAGEWDDVVVAETGRRVPLWGLLLGVYLASGYWELTAHTAIVLDRSLFTVAVASATFLLAAVVSTLTREYGPRLRSDHSPVTTLMQNVARIVVMVIGLLTILNGLGVSIVPMLTALGVGGLAVALALQDTLANLFAGFYVTLARQIRVGDYVRLDSSDEGYLVDIAWRSARIRSLAGNIIIVPNAKLAQAIITNYDEPEKDVLVSIDVGVDYASDLRHVERVTTEVATEVLSTTLGGVAAFVPVIRYHTFGESSVDFTVNLRARTMADHALIRHTFVMRLHERFAAEGIQIPFPIRAIVSRDGRSRPLGPAGA